MLRKPAFDHDDDNSDVGHFFDKRLMSLGNYSIEKRFVEKISVNGAAVVEKSHGEICCRSFLMHASRPVEPSTEPT